MHRQYAAYHFHINSKLVLSMQQVHTEKVLKLSILKDNSMHTKFTSSLSVLLMDTITHAMHK